MRRVVKGGGILRVQARETWLGEAMGRRSSNSSSRETHCDFMEQDLGRLITFFFWCSFLSELPGLQVLTLMWRSVYLSGMIGIFHSWCLGVRLGGFVSGRYVCIWHLGVTLLISLL